MRTTLKWRTGIIHIVPNEIRLQGYDVAQLMKRRSFVDLVYLALRGELPDRTASRLLNACMVMAIDHSVIAPSGAAARFIASGGSPLQAAVAGGLLALGDHHGGAVVDCAHLLMRAVELWHKTSCTPTDAARGVVIKMRAEERRLPGYGHPIHTDDPRVRALLDLCREVGHLGPHTQMAVEIEACSESVYGRRLNMNPDSVGAGILLDLGFDPEQQKGILLLARCLGMVTHALEEVRREPPLRSVPYSQIEYDGPPPRELPEE